MLTSLQAVNRMLAAVPIAQVSSLSLPKDPVTVQAIEVLSEARRWFLLFGWEFNREDEIELTPNVSDEIDLPSTYMSIETVTYHRLEKRIVQRGAKLYNATDHTFTFDGPVKINALIDVAFEDMPDAAQEAVVAEAARRLKYLISPEATALRALSEIAQMAFTNARVSEQRSGNFNAKDDYLVATSTLRTQRRRGPYVR